MGKKGITKLVPVFVFTVLVALIAYLYLFPSRKQPSDGDVQYTVPQSLNDVPKNVLEKYQELVRHYRGTPTTALSYCIKGNQLIYIAEFINLGGVSYYYDFHGNELESYSYTDVVRPYPYPQEPEPPLNRNEYQCTTLAESGRSESSQSREGIRIVAPKNGRNLLLSSRPLLRHSVYPRCAIMIGMQKIELHIEGMHCGSCAVGIQMLTSQLDGVKSVEVSYEGKQGTFEFDPAKVTKEKIVKTIEELGYKAS